MSGLIPEEKIAEIKESSNIRELIADYVSLKKMGRNYQGLCPFHSEKLPSFTVSEEKQIFHCFGCGVGGNIFHFLMKLNNLSFPEAVREVAKKYGIPLPEKKVSPKEKREQSYREKLFELNQITANFYHGQLKGKGGAAGWDYLRKREIPEEIIDEFLLGYGGTGGEELVNFLKKEGIPLNLAETNGLIAKRGQRGFYDIFRKRIIFPIIDQNGKVLGFGGRVIGDTLPKYLNSPDSVIYSKRQSMYGLNIAGNFIRRENMALVVEGYFDLLALAKFGIKNVVATLGTALTHGNSGSPGHINILSRYSKNIITIFDGDKAGMQAVKRSLPLFLDEGISPKALILPYDTDPDQYIHQVKGNKFREEVKQAVPMIDFLIEDALKTQCSSSIEGKLKITEEIVPILRKIKNDIERDYYIEKISGRLGVKETRIRSLTKESSRTHKQVDGGVQIKLANRNRAEKFLVQLMLLHDQTVPVINESLILQDFVDQELQKLGIFLIQVYNRQGKIDPFRDSNLLNDENLRNLLSELSLMEEGSIINVDKILKDCIQKIKLDKIRREKEKINSEIKIIQESKGGNATLSNELLKRSQDLLLEEKRFKLSNAANQ